jgi:hypothetical protein
MDKQLAQHRTQEQGSWIAAAAHLNYEFAMYRGVRALYLQAVFTHLKNLVHQIALGVGPGGGL